MQYNWKDTYVDVSQLMQLPIQQKRCVPQLKNFWPTVVKKKKSNSGYIASLYKPGQPLPELSVRLPQKASLPYIWKPELWLWETKIN